MPRIVEAYVEYMQWREDAVVGTALAVVNAYRQFLPDYGTRSWTNEALAYMTRAMWGKSTLEPSSLLSREHRKQARKPLRLTANGFALVFKPPTFISLVSPDAARVQAVPPMILHHNISAEDMTQEQRAEVTQTAAHIMGHAAKIFNLGVKPNPLSLVYPKAFYGEKFRIRKALLVD